MCVLIIPVCEYLSVGRCGRVGIGQITHACRHAPIDDLGAVTHMPALKTAPAFPPPPKKKKKTSQLARWQAGHLASQPANQLPSRLASCFPAWLPATLRPTHQAY